MSEPRFYDPALDATAATWRLDGDEGHHLTRVLRLARGARIRIFDGRGVEVRAELISVEKAAAVARIVERVSAAREPDVAFTLVQAALKGDKMDAVVRDATMMGVRVIQPVLSVRTVVSTRSWGRDGESVVTRWHRVAVASAKQCGRATVPIIERPKPLEAVLRDVGVPCRLLLVEPSAAVGGAVETLPVSPPPAARVLIGPEGGWSAEEVAAAVDGGWTPWSLGALTLRADAAALVALAILSHAWRGGQQG
jgi:16S rRNA (uracil1498-N3)-methyltransferase